MQPEYEALDARAFSTPLPINNNNDDDDDDDEDDDEDGDGGGLWLATSDRCKVAVGSQCRCAPPSCPVISHCHHLLEQALSL
jgi:hypothetical protein